MTDTSRLSLPVIEAAQAQKHVPHNEALALLDALVQLAIESRTLAAPPASRSLSVLGLHEFWPHQVLKK